MNTKNTSDIWVLDDRAPATMSMLFFFVLTFQSKSFTAFALSLHHVLQEQFFHASFRATLVTFTFTLSVYLRLVELNFSTER